MLRTHNYLILIGLSTSEPLEYFYTENTQSGVQWLEGGCLKRYWEGTDPDGLTGHPWVSNILCDGTSSYSTRGVNYGGALQVYVERGVLEANNEVLDVIGSSIWLNVGSEVSLDVKTGSSVWSVGAPLSVVEREQVHFVDYGDQTPPTHRHYHALDFLQGLAENVHDTHINNGSANANNLVWLTQSRVDPSSVVVVNCEDSSWVDYHLHTGGALYLPFAGSICFHTDQIRCIQSGEARWTSPNLFYYESFKHDSEPNQDSLALSLLMGMDCVTPLVFAVTNFDPSSPLGVPNFTELPCVMPSGPQHRWGYCEQVVTWTTRYTPRVVTISHGEH